MTTYRTDIILREMDNLIRYSCHDKTLSGEHFETMHRAIIKKHFRALKVEINREKKEIDMKIPVSSTHYVEVYLECPNLEGFLTACIDRDKESLSFYQNMLTYYNVAPQIEPGS